MVCGRCSLRRRLVYTDRLKEVLGTLGAKTTEFSKLMTYHRKSNLIQKKSGLRVSGCVTSAVAIVKATTAVRFVIKTDQHKLNNDYSANSLSWVKSSHIHLCRVLQNSNSII